MRCTASENELGPRREKEWRRVGERMIADEMDEGWWSNGSPRHDATIPKPIEL